MIIFKWVTECHETGEKYDTPVQGIAYLAQGATGRWCEVLHAGPATLARMEQDGTEILTADEARIRADALPNSRAGF
jgi:hypothetical protein